MYYTYTILFLLRYRLSLPVSSAAHDEGGTEHRKRQVRVDDLAGGSDTGAANSGTDRRQARRPPNHQ